MTFVDDFFGPQQNNKTLVVAPYARDVKTNHRFDEFVSLCAAAELTPVGVEQAVVREIHPGTFFRSGTIERLREQVKHLGAGVVAVDAELTPVQQRQLQQLIGASVLERSAIILTIFGRRATSRAGKLQVELAQSQYLLPRLVGLWQHFDRERGGFGVRGGAGEKQIEIDRRLVQQRITKLRRELADVERTQEIHRHKRERSSMLHAAIVGYTNVGKSTLLRELSKRDVFVKDMVFATLDTLTRKINLGNVEILLTDTVGFVRDLPHNLVAAFKGTLTEAVEADVLIHVLDAAAPEPQLQVHVTNSVLAELGGGEQPTLYVLNKVDLLRDKLSESLLNLQPQVQASLARSQGLDAIVDWLRHQAANKSRMRTVSIPVSRPDLIQRAEAEALRPGRWSSEHVEYDLPAHSSLALELST